MAEYELQMKYSKKFVDTYGTAKVLDNENGKKVLFDCYTPLVVIDGIKAKILYWTLNDWELELCREFLRQNHFEVGMRVRQFKEKYCLKEGEKYNVYN